MWKTINRDFRSFARSNSRFWRIRVIFLSPGLSAVLLFRIQDYLFKAKMLPLAYLIHRLNLILHGIDILPGAKVGSGLRIDHPVGIVIGAGSRIGENCIIMQNVTIGTRHLTAEKYNDEFPEVGHDVTIGAGAVVLGGVKLGSHCKIGANSVILADVPSGVTVTGIHKNK